MVASIYLSEKLDMKLQHLWIGTIYRCANQNIQEIHNKSFEHYFKERIQRCDYRKMKDEIHKVYTEWLPTNNPNAWYHVQSYGQKLLQIKECRELSELHESMISTESFLIEASYLKNVSITKEEKTRIYQTYFLPRDYLLEEITPYQTKQLIGVCIRKTDF